MASEVLSSPGIQIRDNLVTTAVKFLNNPNVQRCTIESKERFLRSKGLTDPEIHKALEKTAEMLDLPSMASELMMFQAKRNLWRDHMVPLLIYGGIAYSCYWFYKNCLRQLLFVEQPKKKTTSECIDELRKSLDVLNANVTSLRGDMQTATHQNAARSQITDLQADIASIKGILLNRNQFPSLKTPASGGIPLWQVGTRPTEERPRSRRSESGGSNSSEEQAAKNSDSSLEIMENRMLIRGTSAYMMWLNENRENIKAQYPGLMVTEVARKGGELWKKISQTDKTVWEKKAAKAKAEYEKLLAAYNDKE